MEVILGQELFSYRAGFFMFLPSVEKHQSVESDFRLPIRGIGPMDTFFYKLRDVKGKDVFLYLEYGCIQIFWDTTKGGRGKKTILEDRVFCINYDR